MLLLVACRELPAAASGHGALDLRILDPEGRPVEGAEVTLTLKNTWRKRTVVSDAGGKLHFHALAAEPFRVTVQARGFDTVMDSRPCLVIVSGRSLRHQIVLRQVGARRVPQPRCPDLLPEPGASLPL